MPRITSRCIYFVAEDASLNDPCVALPSSVVRARHKLGTFSRVKPSFPLPLPIAAQVAGRYINDNFDPSAINCTFVKLKAEKRALVKCLRDIAPGEEVRRCPSCISPPTPAHLTSRSLQQYNRCTLTRFR